jgi:hypothetical protein
MSKTFRERPCHSCPYRKDVPSGIWAESEYQKLPDYDAPTSMQPPQMFACHDGDGKDSLCRGWWDCHSQNQPGHELLSVRLSRAFGKLTELPPVSDVECFESGQEACDHGLKELDMPSEDADRRIEILMNKHPRIQKATGTQPDAHDDADPEPTATPEATSGG